MTRVRFDPSFVEDERWEHLGGDALVLHFVACSYALRTLSDGVLTAARVRTLTPLVSECSAIAERLVEDGLWEKLPDGRLRVCQVRDDLRHADGRGDEQPSRAFVEKERERARLRKETFRARKKENAERNAVPTSGRNALGNTPRPSADQSSAVQDPPGPGPALPASAESCADGMCDGFGTVEGADGRVSKCADQAWHRANPPWKQAG
jgi:hypothetical protein